MKVKRYRVKSKRYITEFTHLCEGTFYYVDVPFSERSIPFTSQEVARSFAHRLSTYEYPYSVFVGINRK